MGLNVLIIDAERIFADALSARLQAEDDIAVAVPLYQYPEAPAASFILGRHADVVLIDADLPGGGAMLLCEELAGREGAPRMVMLSHSSEAQRIADAIRAGAVAWLRKDESLDQLLRVIRGVAAGETWLPRAETGAVLKLLLHEREIKQRCEELLAALTPRELEVLSCMAEGAARYDAACYDVAQRLHLSENTVRTHLKHLIAKLGVHSTLEAVALTRSELGLLRHSADRISQPVP